MRLNVHVYVLALDGVYVRERADGPLTFHALPTPSAAQVADVARRTAERLGRAFKAQGRPSPWDEVEPSEPDPEALSLQQPGLFACYEAAARGLSVSGERAGQPALRLVVGPGPAPGPPRARTPSPEPDAPVAEALGVNVHAKQLVDGRDRKQLERLARHVTRPPLVQDRVELRADGRLELTLKNVWKDGTRAVLLEPDDLLVRLCAAVPAPRMHLLRYFGVLSSHHSSRSEVTPTPSTEPGRFTPPPAPGDQLALPVGSAAEAKPARRAAAAYVGSSGTCFALTSSTVSVAAERCAGRKRPPLRRRSRGCSPSTASELDPRLQRVLRACPPDSSALRS